MGKGISVGNVEAGTEETEKRVTESGSSVLPQGLAGTVLRHAARKGMEGTWRPRAAKARRWTQAPASAPVRCATLGRQVNLVESPSSHPQSENATLYVFGF